jgi:dTDP-4-dehydrorhamnose reductase
MMLITGKNGQLGSELQKLLSTKDAIFCDSKEADITNADQMKRIIDENQIETIINCAAYTAVDKAESEPELAFKVNHIGVENLAKLSSIYNIKLIHISTDYVFDGTKREPYNEEDLTNPLNVYGLSKLRGEHAVLDYAKKAIIIRTSWLYSKYGNNFVKTMLRLAQIRKKLSIVTDQVGTPTSAKDLALAILKIIPQLTPVQLDIYHYSNEGQTTWFDFAQEIFQKNNFQIKLNPIMTKDYPTPARRPLSSVLEKGKIKKVFSLEIPEWKESFIQNFHEANIYLD